MAKKRKPLKRMTQKPRKFTANTHTRTTKENDMECENCSRLKERVAELESNKASMTLIRPQTRKERAMSEYYYLKKGDIIKKGDEVDACNNPWHDNAKWVKATCIGEQAPDPQYVAHRQYRRRLP